MNYTYRMHASYLTKVFDRKDQDNTIKQVKEIIKERQLKFDNFLVTGVSGITMGAILSRTLKKGLTIVRKDNDKSHSYYAVENYKVGSTYIFLDDLIASGNTYKKVVGSFGSCNEVYNGKSKIIGTILYHYGYPHHSKFMTNQQVGKYIKNS